MEQILLAYDLPKETIIFIMMFYKIIKEMLRSPNANDDFFDIVAGFLQYINSAISINNLLRLCTSSVNRSNKNGFT